MNRYQLRSIADFDAQARPPPIARSASHRRSSSSTGTSTVIVAVLRSAPPAIGRTQPVRAASACNSGRCASAAQPRRHQATTAAGDSSGRIRARSSRHRGRDGPKRARTSPCCGSGRVRAISSSAVGKSGNAGSRMARPSAPTLRSRTPGSSRRVQASPAAFRSVRPVAGTRHRHRAGRAGSAPPGLHRNRQRRRRPSDRGRAEPPAPGPITLGTATRRGCPGASGTRLASAAEQLPAQMRHPAPRHRT